ncbi:hypothetical protein CTI12_AA017250 [Artemisia annua]|uniref:Uncharacterized protein n=1 Tax=Artemisia annua TaxID=35608 RepID=A0A2U1QKQ1_ARTAN|nr:hypothetical protein CTI12_AA017250 [Artemisia annua]
MNGHTIDRCFELVGYPPGFVKKNNNANQNNANHVFENRADAKRPTRVDEPLQAETADTADTADVDVDLPVETADTADTADADNTSESSSRKDTENGKYATETTVSEGMPSTSVNEDDYTSEGEDLDMFGKMFESPEPAGAQTVRRTSRMTALPSKYKDYVLNKNHNGSKHFEIDLYFLREKVASGFIKTVKVKSEDNVADLFTKGLNVSDHNKFCKVLGLLNMFQDKSSGQDKADGGVTGS